MKLNVEQMKEKFGVVYGVDLNNVFTNSICHIKEYFTIHINPHMNCFDSPDIAETYFNKALDKEKDMGMKYLEGKKDIFRKSSFFEKNNWRIKNKRFSYDEYVEEQKENLEKEYLKVKNKPVISYIDPNKIFDVPDTKGVEAGSSIYLVAGAESSQISMGVHKGKIIDFYYFVRNYDAGLVDISGKVEVISENENQIYGLNSHNGEIIVNRMGITLFTDLEEAIEFNEKNMKELQAKNEVRLNEIRLSETSPTLKP